MLVAAMNPCPCGFFGDLRQVCSCTPKQIHQYRAKISGPLLDRIDIQIQVPAVKFQDLADQESGDGSQAVRDRVVKAREVQRRRFAKSSTVFANAHMTPRMLRQHCPLDEASQKLLETAMERLGFSARAFHRILKIARTIADLDVAPALAPAHVAEAIQYRTLDRKLAIF
jgi:magnesium chelatase family protein